MAAAQHNSAEDPHATHDEVAPGTSVRVIPGRGATRPTGSGWLRRRVRPPNRGGALLPPSPNFPTKSRPRPARGNRYPEQTETGQDGDRPTT